MVNNQTLEFLKKYPERKQVVLVGMETHICVLQTFLELSSMSNSKLIQTTTYFSQSTVSPAHELWIEQRHSPELLTLEASYPPLKCSRSNCWRTTSTKISRRFWTFWRAPNARIWFHIFDSKQLWVADICPSTGLLQYIIVLNGRQTSQVRPSGL